MELDITDFFKTAAPADYSASAAELGQDAGRITWRHACEDSPDHMLLDTEDKRDAFRAHVKGFGAWTAEEIAARSDVELNALCLQMVSGDMREADIGPESDAADWNRYQRDAESGRVSGRIYQGGDGRVYYYIGD
jgi:hypothetical protein